MLFRGFLLPALVPARPRTFVGIALVALAAQMAVPLVYEAVRGGHTLVVPGAGIAFGLNLALLITAAAAWLQFARRPLADAAGEHPARDTSGFALAALFSTAAWTLMHLGYSLIGLAEVFLIGLYFCWLMWRFGNLWLTIALHAFYNGMQMVVLMLVPLPMPTVPA
jgi:hypothetical protein